MYLPKNKIKLALFLIFFGACGDNNNEGDEVEIPEVVSYQMDIQPLFDSSCINCHGNNGELSLSSYQNTMKGGKSGATVIPNNGKASLLITKLNGTASGQRMPPEPGKPLSETKIALVTKWINQGAKNN